MDKYEIIYDNDGNSLYLICNKCKKRVERGIIPTTKHLSECYDDKLSFTSKCSKKDIDELFKLLSQPQEPQKMIMKMGIEFAKAMDNDTFLSFFDAKDKDIEYHCDAKCYEYIHKRFDKLKGIT